jgi:hypothetical protein
MLNPPQSIQTDFLPFPSRHLTKLRGFTTLSVRCLVFFKNIQEWLEV